MKVSVDKHVCIGSGNCVEVAKQIFAQNEDDGSVVLLKPEVDGELEGAATYAESICPVGAIVTKTDSN